MCQHCADPELRLVLDGFRTSTSERPTNRSLKIDGERMQRFRWERVTNLDELGYIAYSVRHAKQFDSIAREHSGCVNTPQQATAFDKPAGLYNSNTPSIKEAYRLIQPCSEAFHIGGREFHPVLTEGAHCRTGLIC
jgi:hypothetical protein